MSRKPRHIDIKKRLQDRMEFMSATNQLPMKGGFIEYDFLDQTLGRREIRLLLKEDFEQMSENRLDELSAIISQSFKKTYALLLMSDRADAIRRIVDDRNRFDDDHFFNAPFQVSRAYEPDLCQWRPQESMAEVRDILIRKQWLIPPRLVSNIHQQFPAREFIFPFVEKPELINYGSFGGVYKVRIAARHLEFSEGFGPVSVDLIQAFQYPKTAGKLTYLGNSARL